MMGQLTACLSIHRIFIVCFGTLYGAFLWTLFGDQSGFILGDYGVQFYPWMQLYSESLKAGELPLWTPLIQCGFPLFAEGQTGMLYLLNIILFKFLPFKAAYNSMFLLHFLMGGIFTYIFSLKKGMTPAGGTISALCFTFGSAYAGCFYNIVAMRSLVWFPLALFLVEKFLDKKKILPLILLALVQSQSWLGGFPQFALYAALFVGAYFFLRLRESAQPVKVMIKPILWFAGAMFFSMVIALPQLWATFELASRSTRVLYDKEFALWGSVAPWSLATLFMYSWGTFLRYKVYVGVWPIMTVLTGGFQKRFTIWWVLIGLSLFFALGTFNPVNWALLYVPGASLLRNPSKFLFFTAFFLAILAGFSFDSISERAFARSIKVMAVFICLAAGAWAISHFGADLLGNFGRWYTKAFIFGKSFHQKTPEEYFRAIESVLTVTRHELSPAKPFFWIPLILGGCFVGWLALWKVLGSRFRWKGAFICVLAVDLFLFGKFDYGTGFVGNVGPFPDTSLVENLPKDGRWLDLNAKSEALFPPNRNILTGHAQVGAYSPLLDKDYYLLTKDLGALDDSFGRSAFSQEFFGSERDLVDFLGIKYIIVPKDTRIDSFRPLFVLGEDQVYLNEGSLEEFSLAAHQGFSGVRVIQNTPMYALVETESEKEGFLVRSQLYSKDWQVRVDGERVLPERVGSAFQGVRVPEGGHRVEFWYRPVWFIIGRWFYLGGLAVLLFGGLICALIPSKGRCL